MNVTRKKYISLGLIGFGLFYSIFSVSILGQAQRELVLFMLVFGVLALCAGLFLQVEIRKCNKAAENERLKLVFYGLLKTNNGRLSVLDFALCANIDGTTARKFIEQQASQFSVVPEIDDNGTVFYNFK